MPSSLTIELGDTIQWLPLDEATMMHTVTSDDIPEGAAEFDQLWQLPADTFFQYVPEFIGVYNYVCTPHIELGMVASFTVIDPLTKIEEFDPVQLALFPNPCVAKARVNISSADPIYYTSLKAVVRTIDGKVVQELNLLGQNSTEVSFFTKELESGVYVISILANDNLLKSSRLIVL